MSKTLHNQNQLLVDLKSGVFFHTNIPPENHAALRSGFAGYPANPRWNISKFQAWKTGYKLCQALKQGDLVVRPSDSLLVNPKEAKELEKNHQTFNKNQWLSWSEGIRQVLKNYQLAQQ